MRQQSSHLQVEALQVIINIRKVAPPDDLFGSDALQGDLGGVLIVPLGEPLHVALLPMQVVVVEVGQAPAKYGWRGLSFHVVKGDGGD